MIYATVESQSIEEILKTAHEDPKNNIRVIIVDSSPEYPGRSIIKRLAAHGIKCQYTLISMVNFVI